MSNAMSAARAVNLCPVVVRGKHYPSQKAAAKDLGVVPSAISNRLSRDGHLDGILSSEHLMGNRNAKSRPVTIFGRSFPSVKQAAEHLGVARSTVRRFLSGEATKRKREYILGRMMEAAQ